MILKQIIFKRTKESEWKLGFMFECNGDMNEKIIDERGDIIEEPIYDYETMINVIDLGALKINSNKVVDSHEFLEEEDNWCPKCEKHIDICSKSEFDEENKIYNNEEKNLDELLEKWVVMFPGSWKNDLSNSIIKDWYAVSNDDGIITYFQYENQALAFRLMMINAELNLQK